MLISTTATILLTLGVFFWGCSFVAVKEALNYTDVFTFIFLRFIVAGLILAVVSFKKFSNCNLKVISKAIVSGGVLAFSFIAQTIGIRETSPSNAAFITGLSVVLVPIIVTGLDRKPPGILKITAVVIAFVGLGLLTLKEGFALRTGDIWLLICAVGFAIHIVMMNRYVNDVDSMIFSTLQLLVIAVVAGAGILANNYLGSPLHAPTEDKTSASHVLLISVVFCAVFASAYVYTVQTHYQRYISEFKAAIIIALEPLFAAIAAYFYYSELLSARALTGGAMILIGAILVDINIKLKEKSTL